MIHYAVTKSFRCMATVQVGRLSVSDLLLTMDSGVTDPLKREAFFSKVAAFNTHRDISSKKANLLQEPDLVTDASNFS